MNTTTQGSLRVIVDCDLCAAVQMCSSVAPQAFHLGEDACSVFAPTGHVDTELVVEAAEACPMQAITLIDVNTGRQLYP